MMHCLKCGLPMKGHMAEITVKLDTSKNFYTWECLNKECEWCGRLFAKDELPDEFTWLIQQVNALKVLLGVKETDGK